MKSKYTAALITPLVIFLGCSNSSDHEVSASGTIEATEVTVSAKVSGQIIRVLVDEGSSVKVGDTLVLIDPNDYEIQLRQAQANYAAAEAQDAQAKASLKNARDDLRRMEELSATGSVTPKQLDDAQMRFTVAQQALAVSQARRDQARAQLEAARKKLADCAILAPLSGTITKRFVLQGELAGLGTPVVRIANLDEMDIMIYVSATDLPKVKLGQTAAVKVDAFRNREFTGRVVYISPVAEFTPKNIQTRDERTKLVFGVKVRVANPDGSLKAGLPADVFLSTAGQE
jgi:HlyD family secretion protein